MKVRLQELQNLMEQGGLRESAAEMENLRVVAGHNEVRSVMVNLNTNATVPKSKDVQTDRRSVTSESVETIYESAVKKRGSSSSEDALVNTSDELSDNERNDKILGFLAETAAAVRRDRECERGRDRARSESRQREVVPCLGTSQDH